LSEIVPQSHKKKKLTVDDIESSDSNSSYDKNEDDVKEIAKTLPIKKNSTSIFQRILETRIKDDPRKISRKRISTLSFDSDILFNKSAKILNKSGLITTTIITKNVQIAIKYCLLLMFLLQV